MDMVQESTSSAQTTESDTYHSETDAQSTPNDTESTEAPAQSTEAPAQSTDTPDEPTNPAPDFTVVDKDGNEVKLSEMRGKPVVVNFWATWCGYCKLEMPDFDEMYKKYGEDVHFMMVNMTDASETVQVAKKYIDKEGYSFPVYFDTKSQAAHAYGVSSLPASYFIDAKGNLVAHAIGAIDAATIEKGIEMIKN